MDAQNLVDEIRNLMQRVRSLEMELTWSKRTVDSMKITIAVRDKVIEELHRFIVNQRQECLDKVKFLQDKFVVPCDMRCMLVQELNEIIVKLQRKLGKKQEEEKNMENYYTNTEYQTVVRQKEHLEKLVAELYERLDATMEPPPNAHTIEKMESKIIKRNNVLRDVVEAHREFRAAILSMIEDDNALYREFKGIFARLDGFAATKE